MCKWMTIYFLPSKCNFSIKVKYKGTLSLYFDTCCYGYRKDLEKSEAALSAAKAREAEREEVEETEHAAGPLPFNAGLNPLQVSQLQTNVSQVNITAGKCIAG